MTGGIRKMEVLTVDYRAANAPALFCQSLQETGFAVLHNHPIDQHLMMEAYEKWREFFQSGDKQHYVYQKPAQDGYFPFRTEKAKNSQLSDLKEFYHFYKWGKIPPTTKAVTLQISDVLTCLAMEILQWVEEHLPNAVKNGLSMPLSKMIVDSPNTLLRILHYPPVQIENAPAVRAAPHEDINLLTLLPAATAPGLEVLAKNKEWHAVNCDIGNIVVNVGDMLQLCTQGFYQSTTHRVVNPNHAISNTSRFSMPLFLHPHPKVLLSETRSAEQYLHERLRQIGIY